jgi:hypothetical protein
VDYASESIDDPSFCEIAAYLGNLYRMHWWEHEKAVTFERQTPIVGFMLVHNTM